MLKDRKCIASLENIGTNVFPCLQYSKEDAQMLVEEVATLFVKQSGRKLDSTYIQAHMRSHNDMNLGPNNLAQSVHFEETMYDIGEDETLETYVSQHFPSDNYPTLYTPGISKVQRNFDYSHIYVRKVPQNDSYLRFCVDITTLRLVIGQPQVAKMLRQIERMKIPYTPSSTYFRFYSRRPPRSSAFMALSRVYNLLILSLPIHAHRRHCRLKCSPIDKKWEDLYRHETFWSFVAHSRL